MLKIRRSRDRLILTMGIPVHGKDVFLYWGGPWRRSRAFTEPEIRICCKLHYTSMFQVICVLIRNLIMYRFKYQLLTLQSFIIRLTTCCHAIQLTRFHNLSANRPFVSIHWFFCTTKTIKQLYLGDDILSLNVVDISVIWDPLRY